MVSATLLLSLFVTVALGKPVSETTPSASHAPTATPPAADCEATCQAPEAVPALNGTTDLKNFGMLLYPGFDWYDVFGTLEPLKLLAYSSPGMKLHLISTSLDPVPTNTAANQTSAFWPDVLPNAALNSTEAKNLDVLMVPGGTIEDASDAHIAYIKEQYPKVKLFMTICTGAGVAAKAGVLDGKLATTNKAAWAPTTAQGPKVKWVAPARYVKDGKTWSSSGVTSGLDMAFDLVRTYWSEEFVTGIAGAIEHVPRPASDDPFAAKFNVTGVQLC